MEDLGPTFRSWARTLSREDFVSRASGYYLVIGSLPNEEDPFSFETRTTNIGRLMKGGLVGQASAIVALKKNRSPYSTLISVGRARNCDIVLRASTVSKLHAQFVVHESGWKLVDRDSANATEINGRALEPNEPTPVAAGDRIKFGTIECLFTDGEILFRALVSAVV